MRLGGVRMFLAEQIAPGFEGHHVHFTRLFVKSGGLVKRANVAGNGRGLLMLLAKLRMHDLKRLEEMRFGAIVIAICLREKSEVVRHRRHIQQQGWLMALEAFARLAPVVRRTDFITHAVIGGTQRGMQAADLIKPVGTFLKLIDRLAVVVAGLLQMSQLAVEVTTDLESGGEGVDVIEVRTQHLLRFLNSRSRRMQCFLEVASGAQGLDTILENADEGS